MRTLRAWTALVSAVAAATTLALLPQPATEASTAQPTRTIPVFDGIDRQLWELRTPAGQPVSAQALVVTKPESVTVRAELAQERVPGLETVPSMGRRLLPRGGVAAVNGGFWLSQPVGDPNSYFAHDSRLVSEAETQGNLARGTLAVNADGRALVDRIDTRVSLQGVGDELVVTGVNRLDRGDPYPDGPHAVYVYTPEYGGEVRLADPSASGYRGEATAITVHGLELPASGTSPTPGFATAPRAVQGGTVAIPADGFLVVAYGQGRERARTALAPASPVTATTAITPLHRTAAREGLWATVVEGLAAGPMIVRDGRMTPPEGWEREGFSPITHSAVRAPRSAAGVTADGRVLLATVDGRQPGHSVGMTMAELAEFMIRLGAEEAISLDGGGSTTMVVDGMTTNRPSDGQPRHVANALVLAHDYEFARTERLAGSQREETAAEIATAAYPDGAGEVLLAAAADFPDALAGGPLAAQRRAPVLLSRHGEVPPATREAIRALRAQRVTVLGGTGVISRDVEQQLRGMGLQTTRVAGAGRAETAAAIAAAMGASHDTVFLASGIGFADALSAAPPAGLLGAPILLATRDSLPPATRDLLASAGVRRIVVAGGGAAVSEAVVAQLRALPGSPSVVRLQGPDRFGTARAVNEWAEGEIDGLDDRGVVVATGLSFPDALAGGALAAARSQLLMIVPRFDVLAQSDTAAYLQARAGRGLAEATLLGGHSVLSSHQEWQLDQLTDQ